MNSYHRSPRARLTGLIFILLALIAALQFHSSAETIPPSPVHYFNDYAGLISPSLVNSLGTRLANLEKTSSTQFIVAIFPTMDSDDDVASYTLRIARQWKIGQRGKNNGIILFIFVKDNQGKTSTRLEVGYGLEGVVPNSTAQMIVDNDIRPHIRNAKAGGGQREWNEAVSAGVNSVILALQNEYPGSATSSPEIFGLSTHTWKIILICVAILLIGVWSRPHRYYYGYCDSYSSGGGDSGGSFGGGGGGDFGGGGAGGSD